MLTFSYCNSCFYATHILCYDKTSCVGNGLSCICVSLSDWSLLLSLFFICVTTTDMNESQTTASTLKFLIGCHHLKMTFREFPIIIFVWMLVRELLEPATLVFKLDLLFFTATFSVVFSWVLLDYWRINFDAKIYN